MKTMALAVMMVATLAVGVGCVSSNSGDDQADDETTEASQDELRSVASGFFMRSPLSGTRMNRLRTELLNAEDNGHWVRNQGGAFGMQWETQTQSNSNTTTTKALTSAERTAVAQAAFSFQMGGSRRSYLKQVKVVAPTSTELEKALDVVGLQPMNAGDADSDAQRAKLVAALLDAAKTRSITVLTAKLEYQVDMYWEGALVVIDEDNKQILFATGGYGT